MVPENKGLGVAGEEGTIGFLIFGRRRTAPGVPAAAPCCGADGAAAEMMRVRWPKLAAFIIGSEADVLAYTTFPSQHRTKLHSTNPLERLNKEVKRRADVVGIFPNEESIVRLIGALSSSRQTTTGSSSTATCRSKAWPS